MKLYLLLIPLLAAMACAPSVSQDEYDGLSADFRQSQTEVSELKSQLNTAESKLTELEGQMTELTDLQVGLRERLAAAGQERAEPTATPEGPLFSAGQASALVKDRIRADIRFLGVSGDTPLHLHNNLLSNDGEDKGSECFPLVGFTLPDIGRRDKNLRGLSLKEEYLGQGIWFVQLFGEGMEDGIYSTEYVGNDVYRWKVYESTGTVERIDVDRDYC